VEIKLAFVKGVQFLLGCECLGADELLGLGDGLDPL
jgi:hypothetical protein